MDVSVRTRPASRRSLRRRYAVGRETSAASATARPLRGCSATTSKTRRVYTSPKSSKISSVVRSGSVWSVCCFAWGALEWADILLETSPILLDSDARYSDRRIHVTLGVQRQSCGEGHQL